MDDKSIKSSRANTGTFSQAWEILGGSYRLLEAKFWTLVAISFIGSLANLAMSLGIGIAIGAMVVISSAASFLAHSAILLSSAVLSVLGLVLQLWSGAAIIEASYADKNIGIKNSYLSAKKVLAAYVWTGLMCLGIVSAGLLFFIIPGLVASVWIVLATVVVIAENKRGFEAIFISKDLVKDRLRLTAAFLALVMLIATTVFYASLAFKMQQELWSLFINTLTGAFYAASLVTLYRRLRMEKEAVLPDISNKRKQRYAVIAAVGILALASMTAAMIFVGVRFGNDFNRILKADELQQALAAYNQKQGTYPPDLGRLAPDYLPEVPVDPKSQKTFVYVPTNDGKDYVLIIDYDYFGTQTLTSVSGPIPLEK